MFDRCRVWRHRLSRRAEGLLPPDQCEALTAHLAHCSRCQAAVEADHMLHSVLQTPVFFQDSEAVEAFDTAILTALQTQVTPPWRLHLNNLRRGLHANRRRNRGDSFPSRPALFPTGFFTQIAMGALVAASVTAFCLMSALSPSRSVTANATHLASDFATLSQESAAPPIPLDALLDYPAPRAALLWTKPAPPRLDVALPGQRLPSRHPANGERKIPAASERLSPTGF